MKKTLITLVLITLTSCKVSQWYPVTGAVLGGASGSVAGPVGGGAGAAIGYAGGKTAQLMTENEDLVEKVEALSTGDVEKLIELEMAGQESGFQEFTSTIKKILTIAGSVLLAYLCIPIILARKTAKSCAKEEAERIGLTRAPFPTKTDEKS